MMFLLFGILSFDFRILNFGSAAVFIEKRSTPIEFHKSAITNRQSQIVPLTGGER
ncbi:hypothetical protein SCARR_04150 [Pontiella sulfatireligans]|uniref:Uncharacterized protein n=1 Tax=Pontiella sulfatireligans TaxID=2750658 RepID=A0A6C2UPS6_9BACT|nr:hypothetical protein SCARR_04150 [Pontiella sulfatireligans]